MLQCRLQDLCSSPAVPNELLDILSGGYYITKPPINNIK